MCHASTTSSNCHLMMRGKSWMALKINARDIIADFCKKILLMMAVASVRRKISLLSFNAIEDEHRKGRI